MATIVEREGSASTYSSRSGPTPPPPAVEKTAAAEGRGLLPQATNATDPEDQVAPAVENDVFGNEANAEIHYKTCKW